ncbi:thiamine phosphate synthase [Citricoccus sp. SGAir0253]|nr:thiamine phosphate synthase [Citricoccus sp. SGAir0253]
MTGTAGLGAAAGHPGPRVTRPGRHGAPGGAGHGPLDLRCYLITSGTGRHTVNVAAAAAAAGAGVVQVRAKDATAAGLLELTLAVAEAVHEARHATRVLVDDRADVAFAARRRGAEVHGVHLGQSDLPVADARAMLGPAAIIGLTTGTAELVRGAEAQRELLDYIGAGPFRPTPTKDSGREPLGVDGYPPLVAATSLPIVAIGSVEPADVPALAGTGVAGVALVRGIMDAPDPGAVVHEVLAGFR